MSVALSPLAEAIRAQAIASDPAVVAWVGASAGSGKTKVLTDRVLRLLLQPGQVPGRILCLTFTKAAAAEMATRLAATLGAWAAAPEPKLAAALAGLLGAAPARPTIERARSLFAEVLELPGGMRISTIHGFCQSLLRAFPIEAGLATQFGVVEDADAAALLAEARESVLAAPAGQEAALEALAGLVPPDRFARLVAALLRDRARLEAALAVGGTARLEAALAAHLGVPPDLDEAGLLAAAALGARAEVVRAARLMEASPNKSDRERAAELAAWLALAPEARAARWEDWRDCLLTREGELRAKPCTTRVQRHEDVLAILRREGEAVLATETQRRSLRLLAATCALVGLGAPTLARYRARKAELGLLDFDDLILRAQRILEDPGSAWVLFKLDGGLDHVLLDEAQDSNPAQWGIAAALAGEFFAGQGIPRRAPRTVFAVGDPKQAIYGFQGADAAGFATWKAHFRAAARGCGVPFEEVPLNVSFRSTAPVLALVDAVFAEGPAREGVVEGGERLHHRPNREGMAGCVELWPLLDAAPAAVPPDWAPPEEPTGAEGPDALLAEAIAARIAGWLDAGERLPARDRAMRPGDILVLLRKRVGRFVPRLVRALKERRVPVGGQDRIVLAEQIAVLDLLALGDVLLLPEDDLALACLLKSPLVGLDEDALFGLCRDRPGSLWARLAAHRGGAGPLAAAADWLARLMARADHVTPHALFAEVLGEHRGRARLLARLGPDAADPVDEFLNAALAFERREPPSLQGFLHWLRRGGATVKREAEAVGDVVRIMTVHNAKGLQAPVVILPDTTATAPRDDAVRWVTGADGHPLPLWAPSMEFHDAAWTALAERERAARAREENRLLYVALTRAEDRLLIAGWRRKREAQAPSWHDLVAAGFARLPDAAEHAFPDLALPAACAFAAPVLSRLDCPQEAAPRPEPAAAAPAAVALPGWADRPAPREQMPDPLAPSDTGPAAAPHGVADPAGRRFRRGRLVHALLQHLPDHPAERREAAARAFLARPGHGLSPEDQAATLAETLALLDAPQVAAAFGPGSLAEAPIAGRIGGRMVNGQVDRLLVTAARVLVLDYKTNRPPPPGPAEVPTGYLRQMAAYRALLRAIWPGRPVDCALVWTHGARFMPLPPELLDAHAPDA